jgi:CRP-like cAMP-binding protein
MSSGSVSTSLQLESQNKLLASLPSGDYQRVRPFLRTVPLRLREIIHKQDQPIDDVYFLTSGACSLVKTLQDGHVTEVAIVGGEGVIGASVFFGQQVAECDALVRLPNSAADVMSADAFNAEMNQRGAFYQMVVRYCAALTNQIMQTSVCNSVHSAEQRGCRWLLMTHDRVGRDEFPITHDFMAEMLGVRRPTVTLMAASWQRAGLIGYRRGHVKILNRAGLEAACCECYAAVKSSFSRLLPQYHASREGECSRMNVTI